MKFKSLSYTIKYLSLTCILACTSKTEEVDCSSLAGSTFSTAGGKLQGIIQSKCSGSDCHSVGGKASIHWAIEDYPKLQLHFEHMTEAIESGEMPPAGATKLSSEEKDLFECWSKAGFPQ